MGAMNNVAFRILPGMFRNHAEEIFESLEAGDPHMLVVAFNFPAQFMKEMKTYPASAFRVRKWPETEDSGVITVEVPKVSEAVYCVAYAVRYRKEAGKLVCCDLYMMEESMLDTHCVGYMTAVSHMNLGEYDGTLEGAVKHLMEATGC